MGLDQIDRYATHGLEPPTWSVIEIVVGLHQRGLLQATLTSS